MPNDYTLQLAYNTALNLTYIGLAAIPSISTSLSLYEIAVYNLGGAFLVEFAQDTPPSTYWTDLRASLGINSATFSMMQSAHTTQASIKCFVYTGRHVSLKAYVIVRIGIS